MSGPLFMRRRLRGASLLFVVLSATSLSAQDDDGLPAPPLSRNLTIGDYVAQVQQALPAIPSNMLNQPPGADWLSALTVAGVAAAVNDVTPSQVSQEGPYTLALGPSEINFVKIDLDRGRVRWANKLRRFDITQSPHVAVPEAVAIQMTNVVADQLGIPAAERASLEIEVVREEFGDNQGGHLQVERERMVTLPRRVNGYPVYDSHLRLVIANTGQPTRLLVLWPRFQMPAGLTLRAPAAVAQDIAAVLWEAEFGAVVNLRIRLAYGRYGFQYIPVAVVGFEDTESGQVSLIPLVDVPPDTDQDGVPNSVDNCLDNWEPHQRDADGDGIGDACDNCPDLANSGQADSDGDGTGNACEEPRGVCLVPGDNCETMSPELCAAVGGTYQGNGTACYLTPAGTPLPTDWTDLQLEVYPNPFNPKTQIGFELDGATAGPVTVEVINMRGQVVRRLLDAMPKEAGRHRLTWDGNDSRHLSVAAGVYLVRVMAGGRQALQKVALLR